jgi:hypothetical protein
MKLVLALFLGLLLYPLPAKADEFADVRLVTIMGNATVAEAFSLSAIFDNTTQTIIPDGVQTFTFGALGAFNFAGFTVARHPLAVTCTRSTGRTSVATP